MIAAARAEALPRNAALPQSPRPVFTPWARVALLLFIVLAYALAYAWSAPHTDTADELLHAYGIRHGLSYPLEGPFLGQAIHLGPFWFYLTALPLWISSSWLAVALFIGLVCGTKFVLAYHCGRELIDADFGTLWAVAMFIPGWSSIEELVFLNPNAVAAATLLVLAVFLRANRRGLGLIGFAVLGLLLALAVHVHPTSVPIFLLVVPILWRHQAGGHRILPAIGSAAFGFLLPFLPYVAGQILGGFPDLNTASRYMASQVSFANIVNTPSILFHYIVTGPETIARFLIGWPPAVARAVGIGFGLLCCTSLLAIRAAGRLRMLFFAFLGAVLVFAAWIACMRPTTPMQFVWVLNPAFGALIGLGLFALARSRIGRPFALGAMAATLALNCVTLVSMAKTVHEGEGQLPSLVLDIKNRLPAKVYRDVWFPAYAHSALGRVLCSSRGVTGLHGQLAYVFDKDLGLDTLLACAERSRFLLGRGDAASSYFGMTRAFWRSLSWSPECWVGSLGLATDSLPLLARPGLPVADGSNYLPRQAQTGPSRRLTAAFTAPGNAAIMVTNVLGGYEDFEVLSASADAANARLVAFDDLAALYAPAAPTQSNVRWEITVRASNPAGIDIAPVFDHPRPAAGGVPRCGAMSR